MAERILKGGHGTGEEVLDSFALSTVELAMQERTESVIFRFENSRIVEVWELLDGSELRRQLVDSAGRESFMCPGYRSGHQLGQLVPPLPLDEMIYHVAGISTDGTQRI